MILSDNYLATKAKIAALLEARGWVPATGAGIAICTKAYQTAVGTKEAIAYLAPSGDEVAFFQASYQSEGRNVLSTIRAGWKPLSFAESDDELETLAGAFASEVDVEVANTYAMRLAASQA